MERTKRIESVCPMCGYKQVVYVNEQDYENYKHGMLIQHAFPYLDDVEREAIITGICGVCWDKLFTCDEDD